MHQEAENTAAHAPPQSLRSHSRDFKNMILKAQENTQ